MPTWSFIRHGESQANAEGWFAGRVDTPLTTLGERQAVQARPTLAQVPIERVVCSDLQRAHRTAELLLEGSKYTVDLVTPDLRERFSGDWERRPIVDIESAGDMDIFRSWTGRPPGGESRRDLAARVLPFLASIDDGRDVLVVAHGTLIRTVVGLLDKKPVDDMGSWRPGNCELVWRKLTRGQFAELSTSLP